MLTSIKDSVARKSYIYRYILEIVFIQRGQILSENHQESSFCGLGYVALSATDFFHS